MVNKSVLYLSLLGVSSMVYANGMESMLRDIAPSNTLYCATPLEQMRHIYAERVYPKNVLLNQFSCNNFASCYKKTDFFKIWNDMHQVFAVTAHSHKAHRNRTIQNARTAHPSNHCGYKTTLAHIEPPNHAKGKVARALLYLHQTYQLPITTNIATLKEWHLAYPPQEEELERNEKVFAVQGNRNPFISNPNLINRLVVTVSPTKPHL